MTELDSLSKICNQLNAIIFHLELIRDKNEPKKTKKVSFEALKEINETLPEEFRDEKLSKGITSLEDCMDDINYKYSESGV